MELITQFIDLFLHLDVHLQAIIQQYGTMTYAILFLVVFCETGLVVTPFLPGDSLLFAAGTFAALGALDVRLLCLIMIVAPFFGDNVNYWLGYTIGPKIFHQERVRFFSKKHLQDTHAFYERHGPKTVIIARFIPIVRTFAPFVAGIGRMPYVRFISYSLVGSMLWVTAFVLGGYYFGNIPAVKQNFTLTIFMIILISISPGIVKFAQHKLRKYRLAKKARL